MRHLPVLLSGAVILAFGTLAASAETLDFTIVAPGYTITGTMTGTPDPYNAMAFDLTSIDASFMGAPVTLLPVPPGINSSNYTYDPHNDSYNDVVYLNDSFEGYDVDPYGPVFTAGGTNYELYLDIGGTYSGTGMTSVDVFSDATGADYPVTFSVSPAPTPEPSSLVLLGTGVLAAAGAIRRKMSNN